MSLAHNSPVYTLKDTPFVTAAQHYCLLVLSPWSLCYSWSCCPASPSLPCICAIYSSYLHASLGSRSHGSVPSLSWTISSTRFEYLEFRSYLAITLPGWCSPLPRPLMKNKTQRRFPCIFLQRILLTWQWPFNNYSPISFPASVHPLKSCCS